MLEALEQAKRLALTLDRTFVGDDFAKATHTSQRLANHNPYDGEVLCSVAMATEADVDAAVAVARGALSGPWGGMAADARAALMRALADRIETASELAFLEALDVGKPLENARAEDVPLTAAVLRWYASLLDTYYDLASARRAGGIAQICREAQGVVGIVLPWNYPLYTFALKLAPALAAGNTIVAKPAEDTPLTALRIAQLAIEVGFPAGVINVVPGLGSVAGQAIGLHKDIAAVNFTGSTATGRQFLRYSANSNLKEISLECGGKNPAIVLPDMKTLAPAMDQIAIGFMHNSGQICSSISRLLLPAHLRDEAHATIAAAMQDWPIGDPFAETTRLGPMINARQADKVRAAIAAGRADGVEMLESNAPTTGSSALLVRPVAFFDMDETSALWREELFGPVLSVRFYDDIDTAILSANDTDYGLSGYIFSNDAALTTRVASRLDAGSISINQFGEGDFSTPFGGFKHSGFGGKDKGIHALDQYSRTKSIWWEMQTSDAAAPTTAP